MSIPWRETFAIVKAHLLAQGCAAEDRDYQCMYRVFCEDGTVRKCAAGCLIPDDKYDKNMEGSQVLTDDPTKPGDAKLLGSAGKVIAAFGHDMTLVLDLQNIHDSFDPPQWPQEQNNLYSEYETHERNIPYN
jgi:hypothetical protein